MCFVCVCVWREKLVIFRINVSSFFALFYYYYIVVLFFFLFSSWLEYNYNRTEKQL